MAVEGIGNLVQNFAERQFGQGPTVQPATRIIGAHDVARGAPEDTFTSSSQNSSAQTSAQDAGIFQLPLGTLTAVAPTLLSTQTAPETSTDLFPLQPSPGAAGAIGTANAAQASDTGAAAGQPAAGPAAAAQVQNQIQTLNAALPALGLTNNQIQEIDRIAAQIKDFNPTAYSSLVNQFEAQSEEAEQQKAESASANVAAGSGSNEGGGFQVREILTRDINAPGAASTGSTGSAGPQTDSAQNPSANGNGQPAQVQQPQQNATVAEGSQPANQT